jgi:hypothetical protein
MFATKDSSVWHELGSVFRVDPHVLRAEVAGPHGR